MVYLAFIGLPVLGILVRAAQQSDFAASLTSSLTVQALQLSLVTSAISMGVVVVLGTPLALLLARSDATGLKVVDVLVELPIVLPPVVAGVAMLMAFGRQGLVGPALTGLGINLPFTTVAVVLRPSICCRAFLHKSGQVGVPVGGAGIRGHLPDLGGIALGDVLAGYDAFGGAVYPGGTGVGVGPGHFRVWGDNNVRRQPDRADPNHALGHFDGDGDGYRVGVGHVGASISGFAGGVDSVEHIGAAPLGGQGMTAGWVRCELTNFTLETEWEAGPGEVLVLYGPSGAGKTTTLRAIAGLVRPREGHIEVGGRAVYDGEAKVWVAPHQRNVGYLTQQYNLFPHLTVGGNIRYGLSRQAAPEQRARVESLVGALQLEGMEGRRTWELSGGQQQRVALARALATNPAALLLDEPFSSLDAELRRAIRGEIRAILAQTNIPVILVTHDREEALALGDTVQVIDEGKTLDRGEPLRMLGQPGQGRVARLVGGGERAAHAGGRPVPTGRDHGVRHEGRTAAGTTPAPVGSAPERF